jgi:hypothetical protein
MTADLSVALARRAAAGELDTQVLDWLRAGFEQYARGDCTLEQALRLDRASRIRQRDAALLRAAQAIGGGTFTWGAAVALEAAVRRFVHRVEPYLDEERERELGALDRALLDAHRTGERIPASARQLWTLLRD